MIGKPTDTGAQATAEAPPPKKRGNGAGRPTWLTPYLEAWHAAAGGRFPPDRAARALAPLRAEHGQDAVVAAWQAYLDASNDPGQFCSPERFAATYGRWSGAIVPRPAAPPPPRPGIDVSPVLEPDPPPSEAYLRELARRRARQQAERRAVDA